MTDQPPTPPPSVKEAWEKRLEESKGAAEYQNKAGTEPIEAPGSTTPSTPADAHTLAGQIVNRLAHGRSFCSWRCHICSSCVAELEAALAASQHREAEWQPIETAPKDGSAVLLRIPIDNGSNPRLAIICGFFGKAGTIEMETDNDYLVNEDGTNAEDAWFSQSEDREPWAMMLNYGPVAWAPIPDVQQSDLRARLVQQEVKK